MGIYRFILAAVVVLFHFGGLSWVTGRVAVFGFYTLSGFLIVQVLDRVYLGERRGVGRFFVNRAVRLAPSYLLYAGLTLLVIRLAGGPVDADGRAFIPGTDGANADLLRATLSFSPTLHTVDGVPVLLFWPPLIPQGWSIGVELSFYLIAPLVVMMARRRRALLAAWIGAGLLIFLAAVRSAGLDFEQFQMLVYKNAVASWFAFFLGGAVYFARRRWGRRVRPGIAAALAAAWVLLLVLPQLGLGHEPARSSAVFTEFLWLTLLVSAAICLADTSRVSALDRAAGNLCYAVYLNHFIVGALLIWSGADVLVGSPGTLVFGMAVLCGSAILGAVTYALVERPFERVRARVRGTPVADAAPVPARWPRQAAAVAAGVAVAALVTPPVGVFVERLAASDASPAALSPPFNIRWKPEISENARLRVELDLGLTGAEPVERDVRRRTWTYRLRQPSPERVRSILAHAAVEDTAGIDPARFVILE